MGLKEALYRDRFSPNTRKGRFSGVGTGGCGGGGGKRRRFGLNVDQTVPTGLKAPGELSVVSFRRNPLP